MEQLSISLAYRYVALALMMAEANHVLERLDIPGWKPVTVADVVSYHVGPPRLSSGGSVETSTHLFGFGDHGQLQFIQTKNSEPDLNKRFSQWASMKSLVDTNGAYRLASNWLNKLDVDVSKLQARHPVQVTREHFLSGEPESQQAKKIMLPRFEVRWGTNFSTPAVWVSVLGAKNQPIHIRQSDPSFSRRPHGIVKDPERLLKIKDADFVQYTLIQKFNLIVESSPNPYPFVQLPQPAKNLQPPVRSVLSNSPRRETPLRTLEPKLSSTDK